MAHPPGGPALPTPRHGTPTEELVALRRELRVAKMENEILKRAAASFAKENDLPK